MNEAGAIIRRANPNETEAAIRLVLSGSVTGGDDEQIRDFLTSADARGIDLSLIWVVEITGTLVLAALPVRSAGRTMLIFITRLQNRVYESLVGRLIDAVCQAAAPLNVHLAQVLFDPAEESLERIYSAGGFVRMAELLYLQGTPRPGTRPPPLPADCDWVPYSIDTHALFARTILATYQQSLDCPALNGLRDIEDIIDGHKASGEFDPGMWMLLCEKDAPLGVLLLSITRAETVELVYLGLTPQGRGRNLGELLMKQAMATTAASPCPTLSLAVDSLNVPALKLYYRNGMSRIGSKVAYMRDLRPLL